MRRFNNNNFANANNNNPAIVPPFINKKLIWELSTQINSTGAIVNTALRGNSIFDVALSTGTPLAPNGYSQWKDFYTYYEVVGSKCTATASIGQAALNIALMPAISIETFGSYANAISQPYAVGRTLTLGTGGHDQVVLTRIMRTKTLHGAKLADISPFTANFGSLPVKQFFWNIIIEHANPTSSAIFSCFLKVRIEYQVRMYGRKVVINSTPLDKPDFIPLNVLAMKKQYTVISKCDLDLDDDSKEDKRIELK